eukprot:7839113-Pyramimonas_sp.AAC.2
MRRSFIGGLSSQCAAYERVLVRRRSWACSASRRGPDNGSRVSWRAGSRKRAPRDQVALDGVRHGVDVELLVQRLHAGFLRRDLGRFAMLMAV